MYMWVGGLTSDLPGKTSFLIHFFQRILPDCTLHPKTFLPVLLVVNGRSWDLTLSSILRVFRNESLSLSRSLHTNSFMELSSASAPRNNALSLLAGSWNSRRKPVVVLLQNHNRLVNCRSS